MGQQFKVEKDQQIFVHRLEEKEGSKVAFDNVLLIDNNGKVNVGAPAIAGASVSAKVLKHLKGDKVIVFKKKRRKGYRVKNGHRQYLSEIVIESIVASGAVKATKAESKEAKKSAPAKKAEPKKEAAKTETKAAAPKKEAAPKKASGKADDLKKIEGIGPKIAETLVEAGIATYADLAKSKPEDIAEIISGVRGNHVP